MKAKLMLLQVALLAHVMLMISISTASAEVRVGASCKILGGVKSKLGVAHICVRDGKRLIWKINRKSATSSALGKSNPNSSTSANVPKPIPTPTISLSPSPSPSASPSPSSENLPFATPTPITSKTRKAGLREITRKEVSVHASKSTCWAIIDGYVYDLTSFLNAHRGGMEAILAMCGRDGTREFHSRHGGSSHPEEELERLLIGVLEE